MKKRKFAIFDIDGTIFRSSLLIELTEALVAAGIFPKKARTIYETAYKKWSNRQESYEKYIASVVRAFEKYIKGVDNALFVKVAKRVAAANYDRTYVYTRRLVQELKKKNYYLVAISHSPKAIVQSFCQKLGFDKVYGRDYEVGLDNRYTGKTLYLDLISDKANILRRVMDKTGLGLAGSIGVGDSEGDISIMRTVAQPICFNPNARLYAAAKKAGWRIVVERKDVIYEI